MGNEGVITTGEVQVMSAGSGVLHSEFNASDSEPVSLFQIWIFTDKKGHEPRYDQKKFNPKERKNKWQLLVSPDGQNDSLWIHQNAFISVIDIENEISVDYELKAEENGVYFMLIEGQATIDDAPLEKRDAVGFWEIIKPMKISFSRKSKLLAIEVPMN